MSKEKPETPNANVEVVKDACAIISGRIPCSVDSLCRLFLRICLHPRFLHKRRILLKLPNAIFIVQKMVKTLHFQCSDFQFLKMFG